MGTWGSWSCSPSFHYTLKLSIIKHFCKHMQWSAKVKTIKQAPPFPTVTLWSPCSSLPHLPETVYTHGLNLDAPGKFQHVLKPTLHTHTPQSPPPLQRYWFKSLQPGHRGLFGSFPDPSKVWPRLRATGPHSYEHTYKSTYSFVFPHKL